LAKKEAFNNGLWNFFGSDRTQKAANQTSADISKLKEISEEANAKNN
jgi:hypothetical protein